MADLPETVLQFGGGRFLRAFADFFINDLNKEGKGVGRIVIVQSTAGNRAEALNKQGGKYHVVVRGVKDGKTHDDPVLIESVSRGLVSSTQWDEVLKLAVSPDLRYVLSNTTEVGYDVDPADTLQSSPPQSYPAKLLQCLHARWAKGMGGLVLIPCELQEHNADILRGILRDLAAKWSLDAAFVAWLEEKNHWCSTLVDRIVSGPPDAHPLLAKDEMLIVCEPFAFWAIQAPEAIRSDPLFSHWAVKLCEDVSPYFLRKVRILNGGHTSLVCRIRALDLPFPIVREAVGDKATREWLDGLLRAEVVPTIASEVTPANDLNAFVSETIERFINPFLDHKFADISVNHEAKKEIRLMSTIRDHIARFGRAPPILSGLLGVQRGERSVRAFMLEAEGKLHLTDVPLISQFPDEPVALVRCMRGGLCGTDYHAYRGQQNFFTYPRVLGHELGVEVVECPEGNEYGLKAGDRCSVEPYINCKACVACAAGKGNCCENLKVMGVHMDGGLQERFYVPLRKLHRSDRLSFSQLAVVETLCIGAHAVNRASVRGGEATLVIGAGPIGMSVCQFLTAKGARVAVMDISLERLEFVKSQLPGITTIVATGTGDAAPHAAVLRTFGHLATAVFDATGNIQSMLGAFGYVAHGGRLVFVGHTKLEVSFNNPLFHSREMTVMASRNALGEDFKDVIRCIEEGTIDVEPWITHRARIDDAPGEFLKWMEPSSGVIKAIIEFN